MSKLRLGLMALMLVLVGAGWAGSQANGPEWMLWQRLYHETRAALEDDPAQADFWKQRPLLIKQAEVTARLPEPSLRPVREFRGFARESCITCHDGLEPMSDSHPATFGCTICHGGDGDALEKKTAHADLIFDPQSGTGRRNPSALSVVHLSCGQSGCHAGHDDSSRNQVDRVRRSPMGTLAGVIAGLRYSWGAQATPEARYGMRAIASLPQLDPGSSLPGLEAVPFFVPRDLERARAQGLAPESFKVSHHPADSLLRTVCSQCHLDGKPPQGEFRGQGCAACHVPYTPTGRYRGLDPTIDKTQTGHMSWHRLVVLPPQRVCVQCHKSLDRAKPDADPAPLLPASGRPVTDVHFQKGLECIDCHPSSDIMGDGRLVSRQYEAVRIRCTTCHGDSAHHPGIAQVKTADDPVVRESRHYAGGQATAGDWMVVDDAGGKLANVKVHHGAITVFSKRTGVTHAVPLLKQNAAHPIAQHNERLACTACHSAWVPECTGCHLSFNPLREADRPWSPFTFELAYREPALMVGPDGRVRPMLPQPLRTLTALDSKGHPVPVINEDGDAHGQYLGFAFTNPQGYSGANLAYATHPHSVSRRVRSCVSCHNSPAALGLGEADLVLKSTRSGKNDRADSAVRGNPFTTRAAPGALAKVTPRGQAVAGTHQPGARPFNQEELNRILKVSNCLPCHSKGDDPIYQDIQGSYRKAATERHRDLMQLRLETP